MRGRLAVAARPSAARSRSWASGPRWVAARVPERRRTVSRPQTSSPSRRTAELPAGIDLDRLVDQIVALVDGFGLQGVLDPERDQLASRLNGAVDALIRAAPA
jgi:hypothetical protein